MYSDSISFSPFSCFKVLPSSSSFFYMYFIILTLFCRLKLGDGSGPLWRSLYPCFSFFITAPSSSSSLCALDSIFDPIPIATFTSAFAQVQVFLPHRFVEKRNGGPLNQKLTIYFKYQFTICGSLLAFHVYFNQLALIYF